VAVLPVIALCWLCIRGLGHAGNAASWGVMLIPALIVLIALFIIRGGSKYSSRASVVTHIPPSSPITLGRVASGLARFVLSIAGNLLLLVSLLMAMAVASNLPGLFASGVLDAQMPNDFAKAFGTADWPHLLN